MEGYLGVIQAQLDNLKEAVLHLERAAGDGLAKAKAAINTERYDATNPNEAPEVTEAKAALAAHAVRMATETAMLAKALDDAVARQKAAEAVKAKALAEPVEGLGKEIMPQDGVPLVLGPPPAPNVRASTAEDKADAHARALAF